jgi:hypothetical protein
MEASYDTSQDLLAATAKSELMMDEVNPAERQRSQPFRRFRSIGGRSGADADYVERIESELVLLREENARLRFERAQRPDAGSMIERLKSLSAAQPPDQDHHDEAWHLVSEALVMRDVLIDVCKEIGQTTITLQTRLNDLALDLPVRAADGGREQPQWLPPSAPERRIYPASPPASAH